MSTNEVVAIIDFYSPPQESVGTPVIIDFSKYLRNAEEYDLYGVRILKAEIQHSSTSEYNVVKFEFDLSEISSLLYLQYYDVTGGVFGNRIMPDHLIVNAVRENVTPYQATSFDFIAPCRLWNLKMSVIKTSLISLWLGGVRLFIRFEIYKLLR